MKKIQLFFLFLFLSINKGFYCDCNQIKPALEFYASKYVFEGTIISKVYAKDNLTYTVIFEVSKHYKNGDSPKKLEFTLFAEERYTGFCTSCDWHANMDEKWLVYASLYKGKLGFNGMCSNSKILRSRTVNQKEQKVLNNGNSFKIDNYIYQNETGFNYTKPLTNIDSIMSLGYVKEYENPYMWLNLFIDKNGDLKAVSKHSNLRREIDSIFSLTTEFKIEGIKPLTEFEIDAIELVKQIKKWEIKQYMRTKILVLYIRHLSIKFDKKKKKWSYEL